MDNKFIRSLPIFKESGMKKLNESNVAVFGLGGVGSYAVEVLARAGVGNLTLIDNDTYSESNINRQLYATTKTIGTLKTEVAKLRVLEINPNANVTTINAFVLDGQADGIDFSRFDYIVDAIDTISGKLSIIKRANEAGVPIISCMGAGNKLDPTRFKVADLFSTKVCPLCKVMRKLVKDANISKLKVVYSEEEPIKIPKESLVNSENNQELSGKKSVPLSVSFVPSVMGIIAGGEVIKDLTGINYELY